MMMTLGPSDLSSSVVLTSRSPSKDATFLFEAFARPTRYREDADVPSDPWTESLIEINLNGSSAGDDPGVFGVGDLFEQEQDEEENADSIDPPRSSELRQGEDSPGPSSSSSSSSSDARPVTLISRRLSVSIHLVPTATSDFSPSSSPPPPSSSSSSQAPNKNAAPLPSSPSGSVAVWLYRHDEPLVLQAIRRLVSIQSKQEPRADSRQRIRARELPELQAGGGGGGEGGGGSLLMVCLSLPSGSALVVAPRDLVSSRRGRALLNQFLTQREDGTERSVPPSALASPVPASIGPLDPDPRVLFPTLQVQLLHNKDEWVPFPVNSPIGQDFETDLFKGRLLVVLRPTNPELDPHWNARMFSQRKRRILVQLQGQFKRSPKGTVYAGAEVSEPMQLGLLARGLSGVLLRIVEGFNPTVHYSFGTQNSTNDDEEKAHIVIPAYSFFERLVITRPGQAPPALGSEFEESKESMDRRRNPKEAFRFQFNDIDTYSFSFYSMYMDLPTWQLVNLPIPKGDVSLKTFWRDSLLRICMYERHANIDSSLSPNKQPHLVKFSKYAFLLQIQYSDRKAEDRPEETETLFRMSGSKYVESSAQVATENQLSNASEVLNRSESQLFPIDDETTYDHDPTSERDDDNIDEDRFLDAVQEHDGEDDEFGTEQEIRRPAAEQPLPSQSPPAAASSPSKESSLEMLSLIDAHCPLFLDVIKSRAGYSRIYVVQANSRPSFRTLRECEDFAADCRNGPVQRIVNSSFSPRLSSAERLRRVVGCILANPSSCMPSRDDARRLEAFRAARTSAEAGLFLRRAGPSLNDRERASLRWSGFVARAISDRHWMEEFATVTHRSISFSHPDKRKANARIMIRSIERVTPMPPDACPRNVGDTYSFLEIETLGRSIYLMFAGPQVRGAFTNEIMRLRALAQEDDANSSLASNPLALDIENPADEFMHKSTLWNLKNRRLLNGAKFFFAACERCDALELVSTALRRASAVANDPYDEYEQRHAFLVSAARLKQAHVLHLPEESRLAFFLNLYHLMILHAFIVLGPPDSSLQWITYFNNASYEIADDVFSLAELEHCIVRNRMSPPSQFLSRFVIPKSRYSVALNVQDFRINFALNCGSLSNPSTVCCYSVAKLKEQLDAATRLYLEGTGINLRTGGNVPGILNVSPPELVLYLPRVCQWFLSDFGDGGTEPMLRRIEPYLKDPIRRAMERFKMADGRFDMGSITVRFYNYNFECRPFVVSDP